MEKDFEMRVLPSFCDEQCTIVFSFSFRIGKKKIGEAIILTCSAGLKEASQSVLLQKNDPLPEPSLNGTIAYVKEFEVIEEFKGRSFAKVMEFLKIIGVEQFVYGMNRSAPVMA
ncbi:hypothetical protein LCM00_13340 [Bacillus infantis]|jgi:hypothetical protein|uniref:hypothetical protein n=1 Tax=Bacillus infantis TaxID=324767 RepID=UPI001CD81B01|nr:hypothetical protein [Bacillus infantis]MCA1040491.1 hypothetical protein [Bacillus infantis]